VRVVGCLRVALIIQHAKAMRRILLFMSSLAAKSFQRYLINGTIFGKKSYAHKMPFGFLYNCI
jgi:hypothetical protein